MTLLSALLLLFAPVDALADCAAQDDFTTTMRIARVERLSEGYGDGCWLRGEWTDHKGKASFAPLYTTDKGLCAVKTPATKKLKGSYSCCDAGGMPPPCSWGTAAIFSGGPSGITVVPTK